MNRQTLGYIAFFIFLLAVPLIGVYPVFAMKIMCYALFACAVTVSVQLVGLYLVFTTLIVPALATRRFTRRRLPACYALGALGYAAGLALAVFSDLPPGPLIVWVMVVLAIIVFACGPRPAVVAK